MIKTKGQGQIQAQKILKTLLTSCWTISSSRKPQIPNNPMMCSNNSVYLSHISLLFFTFHFFVC